jgi:hypothetical protein
MIYTKTELGKAVLQDRSLGLNPRQRSAFILFDGTRGVDEVLKLTKALGVTDEDISRLVELALLVPRDAAADRKQADAAQVPLATPDMGAGLPGWSASVGEIPALDDQAHYARAYPIAVRLTSSLGLRGFRLNLAVESAADLEALKDLAPKIKEAVGIDKFRELEDALYR